MSSTFTPDARTYYTPVPTAEGRTDYCVPHSSALTSEDFSMEALIQLLTARRTIFVGLMWM